MENRQLHGTGKLRRSFALRETGRPTVKANWYIRLFPSVVAKSAESTNRKLLFVSNVAKSFEDVKVKSHLIQRV